MTVSTPAEDSADSMNTEMDLGEREPECKKEAEADEESQGSSTIPSEAATDLRGIGDQFADT